MYSCLMNKQNKRKLKEIIRALKKSDDKDIEAFFVLLARAINEVRGVSKKGKEE